MISIFNFYINDYENNLDIIKDKNDIIINNIFFKLVNIEKNKNLYEHTTTYSYENDKTNLKLKETVYETTDIENELQVCFNFFEIQTPFNQHFLDKYKLTLTTLAELMRLFWDDYKNKTDYVVNLCCEIASEVHNIEKLNNLFAYWEKISCSCCNGVWDCNGYLKSKNQLIQFSNFYFGKDDNENYVCNVSNWCVVKNLNKTTVDKIVVDVAIRNECQIENTYTINGIFKHPVWVKFENVKLLKIKECNDSYSVFLIPNSGLQFTIKTMLNRDKYDFETGEIIENSHQQERTD